MLAAVILAGGSSTRMGSPKALLPDAEGRPFVARIVRTLTTAGLDRVLIVTGPHHDVIEAALAADRSPGSPRCVRNPDPARGQLSSLWTAMDALAGDLHAGLLVTLVDVPLIATSTVVTVCDTWRRTRAPIVRPAVGSRRGHPVIFDAAVFDELRAAPLNRGAKAVVHAHAHDAVEVVVDDPGCLVDVDTPDDYAAMRRV